MAKGMYVGIKTVPNMIRNGTFTTFDGWSNYATNYLSISNGCLKGVGGDGATYKYAVTTSKFSLMAGHIYYSCIKYKKSGGGMSRWGMHTVVENKTRWLDPVSKNTAQFTRLSRMYTANENCETQFLLYGCGAEGATDLVIYWDDLFVVDLTALYGAGNEPSLEECDSAFYMENGEVVCNNVSPGVSRKVQKQFVGVNNVARTVKKGFVGVNNVARLFYNFKWLTKFYLYNGNPDKITVNDYFAGYTTEGIRLYLKTTSTESSSTKHASSVYEIRLADGSSLAGKTITLTSKASSNVSSMNYCTIEYRDINNAYSDYDMVSKTTDFTTSSFTIPSGTYRVCLRINQSYKGNAETEFIISSLIIDGEQIF